MILNYIWIGLILLAVIMGCVQFFFFGQSDIFTEILNSTFAGAKNGFEISLGLTGVLALWMGILNIGQQGGVVTTLSRGVAPFFRRIFPEIPNKHPVYGTMFMNFAANMLGLDNAATPMGLKAMTELQELNQDKTKASNAMIMFVVLGASGLTIIPTTIMAYRAQLGAANPADVFLPLLIATYFATLGGLLACCVAQKIKIWDKVILGVLFALTALVVLLLVLAKRLPENTLTTVSALIAAVILLSVICWFIIQATIHKVNVYEAFIDGAKEGFSIAVSIIPYLVSMLVAIAVFRASGVLDILIDGIKTLCLTINVDSSFADALPTAFMKPLSGSGARAMMIETMQTFGADSFASFASSVIQGSTETTFYVLTVYFGAIKISKTRYALKYALISDLAGIVAAIAFSYMFYNM